MAKCGDDGIDYVNRPSFLTSTFIWEDPYRAFPSVLKHFIITVRIDFHNCGRCTRTQGI